MMVIYKSIPDAIKGIKCYQHKVIGVAGGSCCGKTYFANLLAKKLKGATLSMDDYYKGLSDMKDDNFDHPDAIDLALWSDHLRRIKEAKVINKPVYNFKVHERESVRQWQPVFPVIAEGLFALLPPQLHELDLKIFVDSNSSVRLDRRIKRDVALRGRREDDIKKQWSVLVEPMYKQYVAPQYVNADIIVHND
jgi:uridine kinase